MTNPDPDQLPEGLARFINRAPPAPPGERCELCSETLGEEHSHLVDLEGRGLLCTCRPCYLLFVPEGASQGRYRAVPDRYRYKPDFAMSSAQWDELQIPVGLAFFFYNSTLEQTVTFYPSPGGATESLLPLDTWQEVLAANPEVDDTEPDVEALLLRRLDGAHAGPTEQTGFECYLVPIDACYELVGIVKQHWKGFDGGQEVWQEIEAFFARLREHARLVGVG